jgi:hypothetical protein
VMVVRKVAGGAVLAVGVRVHPPRTEDPDHLAATSRRENIPATFETLELRCRKQISAHANIH